MQRLTRILFAIIFCGTTVFAQNAVLNGKISTSDKKPAEFVTIGLLGTQHTTTSNQAGEYTLQNIVPGTYTLVVNMVGVQSFKQEVTLAAGDNKTINLELSETSRQLQEVVISANKSINEKPVMIGKVAIKPMDLPQSTTQVDREVMEQQQTLRVSDALKNVNGVYVSGTTGGGQEELSGRGFTFGSSNTFKNGVRYNNSTMPEMSGIERMEVMKGSTAILFGNVAAGGIINLVTKKPLFENGGEVSMRVGSYDFYKPSLDVYGAVSKNVAVRVNTTYEKARSFRDEVKAERFCVNPSILIRAGKKTDILIEGDFLKDDRTSDFGVGAINYTLIDVPRSRFLGTKWAYYNTEQASASATITHHFSDNVELRSVTSFQEFTSDLFSVQRPNANSQFVRADGRWIRGLQRTTINENYGITQLDLTARFNTWSVKHNLLFGADLDQYTTKTTAYTPLNVYDTVNVFDPEMYTQRNDIPDLTKRTLTSAPTTRTGVYLQDLISLGKKVKVLAGVRFSYFEIESDVLTYSSGAITNTKMFNHAFSPRFGVVYQPLPATAIFASYSNSFTPNTGVDINNEALPPSLIDQYEVGIKNDFFKGLFSANFTVYQIVNSNLAQTSLANGNNNSNIKELAGEVTSQGAELDLSTRPWTGFSLIAGYSFNETKYTKSNTYIVGSLLRYNPNHTANLSIYYQYSGDNVLNGLNAGISTLYFGQRFGGRSTRVTQPNDTYKLIEVNPYTQIDASIGYTYKKTSFRVKVSNILDELSYNVHDDNSVNPIAPRQFAATLTVKF
jgi:iron complex outermembrane receptor protein